MQKIYPCATPSCDHVTLLQSTSTLVVNAERFCFSSHMLSKLYVIVVGWLLWSNINEFNEMVRFNSCCCILTLDMSNVCLCESVVTTLQSKFKCITMSSMSSNPKYDSPENNDGKIHFQKKVFFLNTSKFKQHDTEYKSRWTSLSLFSKKWFCNHFHVQLKSFQVDVKWSDRLHKKSKKNLIWYPICT